MRPHSMSEPRGQVLVIVAVAFTVMIAFLAILFDGANGMFLRREMQNAGDAAALAGANVIHSGSPRGCATTAGAPRATVANAIRQSLTQNLSWFDANTATITCSAGFENQAVAVDLTTTAPRFFGGLVGGDITVATHSAAVNRLKTVSRYSVVQLDPGNPSWPNGRRGCPSVLLSGGPSVTLQATMFINSACTAADGGALATNGGAAQLTMTDGAVIKLVGGYSPTALTISPAPETGVDPTDDPLADLPPVVVTNVERNSKLTLSNETQVLYPGIYKGGIELRNSSIALLRPGIYVIQGGGLNIGAQAKLFAVSPSVSTPSASWANDCPVDQCGVLIFNTSGQGASAAMDAISVAAGATVKLRAYDPDALATGGVPDFENILIWQDANPVPTASYAQPVVELNGGGNVDIRGTVYAPSAKVQMGGNSGGSGGEAVNLTLQFISWDLEFRGNSSFTFYFSDDEFARPLDYGLVE